MTVENNLARFHPITILSDGPEGVWIKGLNGPQKFITVGQEFVIDGQPLKVTETRVSKDSASTDEALVQ